MGRLAGENEDNIRVRASTPADLLYPFGSCAQGTATVIRFWDSFD